MTIRFGSTVGVCRCDLGTSPTRHTFVVARVRMASGALHTIRGWRRLPSSTSARSAGTRRGAGSGAAPAAAPGARSSRSHGQARQQRIATRNRRRPLLSARGGRRRRSRAPADGRPRARPGARRRARPRLARARQRRPRDRQVDAAANGLAGHERRTRKVALVTGEESAAQVKLRAERLGGPERFGSSPETEPRSRLRDARARAPDRVRHRLDPDALRAGARLGAGLGCAGARGYRAPPARREGGWGRDLPRRARHEGRCRRRAARPRAPRRLRAPVRGRSLSLPPRPACGEEPLRLDERARRLRDDPGGARRRRPIRRRCSGAASRTSPARSSPARSRARGRCSSRSRRSSPRPTSPCRAASAPESTRSGSR